MEVALVELSEQQHKQKSKPVQQHLNSQSLPDVPLINFQATPTIDSSKKIEQKKQMKTQQKPNASNQEAQTAQSKLIKKNQKQLVGENFERMNYLYQCATRLACLTTPSLLDCNHLSSNASPSNTEVHPQPLHQHSIRSERTSDLIPSVSNAISDGNTISQTSNDTSTGEVASPSRPSTDSSGATVCKCPSPITDRPLHSRLYLDVTSNVVMVSDCSDLVPLKYPILASTAASSVNNQTTIMRSDDHSSHHPIQPDVENLPSNKLSSSCPKEDSTTNPTQSCPNIDSVSTFGQSGSGFDTNAKLVSLYLDMNSSHVPTSPCLEIDCNPNPTSPCLKMDCSPNPSCPAMDCNTEPTSSCSELECHTNPTSSCREIASNVSSTCRAVGRKCLLRLSHHMKRELCRGCSTPLVPALTASAKIIKVRKKRVLSVRCLTCGVRRKRPCEDMKTLWADQCPTGV